MTEPTEAEKIEIVKQRFGEWSERAMKMLEAGDARPHLVAVDAELERVLEKVGVDQFHGLTIQRRDEDKVVRQSRTHPATKVFKRQVAAEERAKKIAEREKERAREREEAGENV